MRKNIYSRYLLVYLVSIMCGLIMLVIAALLPQGPISANIKESSVIMLQEGCYPRIGDHTGTAQLDNYSDAWILMESAAMNAGQLDSVLTNPLYRYGGKNPVEDFSAYANDSDPESTSFYVRYWMGFRTIFRLLLLFFDYYQIKRYLALVFFCLFTAVICSVAKNVSVFTGWLFAFSIALVRPYVICNSAQFSCCFLIAFVGMLLIPTIVKNPQLERLFFMELGLITMYFDFYTTPVVTFGLPFVYLSLIRTSQGEKVKAQVFLRNATTWLLGYVGMWLAKLLLTQIFTEQDALVDGFGSFFRWVGFVRQENRMYSLFAMVKSLGKSILSDTEGIVVWILGIGCGVSLFALAIKKKMILPSAIKNNVLFLLPAILPVIWFVVANEPTRIHAWFQYRGIAVCYWTLGAYISLIMTNQGAEKKEICH